MPDFCLVYYTFRSLPISSQARRFFFSALLLGADVGAATLKHFYFLANYRERYLVEWLLKKLARNINYILVTKYLTCVCPRAFKIFSRRFNWYNILALAAVCQNHRAPALRPRNQLKLRDNEPTKYTLGLFISISSQSCDVFFLIIFSKRHKKTLWRNFCSWRIPDPCSSRHRLIIFFVRHSWPMYTRDT